MFSGVKVIPFSEIGNEPKMPRIFLMVLRFIIPKMSGFVSLPFSKNQRIVVAVVGKFGSKSALASSQVPWLKAC